MKVAIIGFSARLPGTDPDHFWSDLLEGRDLVTQVDPKRWAKDSFHHPNKAHPGTSYTFSAGSIGDAAGFDADFFGISPREAALMDPQQRLLLELGWEALENSGIMPSSLRGSNCGVYIGISNSDYSYRIPEDLACIDSSFVTGNAFSMAANRLSFFFDLRGPSMAIDTACSSSMVAFHQACRAIVSGETTMALAGGVNLHLHPMGFIFFSKASMLSRQGRCKSFDAEADGFVRAEGGGVFVLKDYDRAMADGDNILAVVARSAVNADGHKTGLTVPSAASQAGLLERVYREAGIDAADIDYVEAHGTGTVVGDPIEVLGLKEALGKRRPAGQPLPIGSVKSNLGHMEAAAGVAGLIKALYCLRHRLIPPTIGIRTPNPNIPFDKWNIKVVTESTPLKKTGRLIIGVNSFGFGGANAHVILESHTSAKDAPPTPHKAKLLPVIVSAKTELALKEAAREFSTFLQTKPQDTLYDVAYNSVFRRQWHEHRAVAFGTTPQAIARALQGFADEVPAELPVEAGHKLDEPLGPAFIYAGNGAAWEGMGKRLLKEVPVFRSAVREVDELFQKIAEFSLEDELAGDNGSGRYQYTEISQPALFALQVGITRMLLSWGITPTIVAGHSVGEIAAAWASGALSLEDAVKVAYHRSRLQGNTKGRGQMTAVGLCEQATQKFIRELDLSSAVVVACTNSSKGVTVSGPQSELSRLETILTERNIFCRRLDLDYAFHGPAMDDIRTDIMRELGDLKPNEGTIPFYSTVTGGLLDGRELHADYWWRNIRKPVLFNQTMKNILAEGSNVFIEIGPHPILRYYLNECLNDAGVTGRIISTVKNGDDDPRRIWGACFQVAMAGGAIDWKPLFPWRGSFVQLPNYPWQRERHWHSVTSDSLGLLSRSKVHPLLGYRLQQHELTWENQIDTQLCPNLADHAVGGAVVFPGAAFAELALAAALCWQEGEGAEIEDLAITSPLLLDEERSKIIRLNINERDGAFTIKGKEPVSSEPWVQHASGRILTEPGEIFLKQKLPALPKRAPDFNGPSHGCLTRAVGLSYGPSYQAIDHGWVENDSVLAVYGIPKTVTTELNDHHLHPALLDCAFQLVFQALKDDPAAFQEGVAFIPSRIGRIVFRAGKTWPRYALAKVQHRAPHSILADFSIFSAEGIPIAVIKDAYFRSIRLNKNASDRLNFIDCSCVPKPHPLAPSITTPASLFEQLQDLLAEVVQRGREGIHSRYAGEIDPLLDSLCSRFTMDALKGLAGHGGHLSSEIIHDVQASNPEIAPFLNYLLETASNDEFIKPDTDGWSIASDPEIPVSSRDIWNILFADYPDYFPVVHSIGRVGMHLSALLGGHLPLAQVCPHSSLLGTLTELILGAGVKHGTGQALGKIVSKGLDELPEGQRFKTIEISEGVPPFASYLCDALDFRRSDYLFATTSQETIDEAQRLLERFPAIDMRQIDTTETISPSADDSFQLAVVNSDFSTISGAIGALKYACSHLAPGGMILFIGYHPARWIDFAFGARRDWWAELPEGHPESRQQPISFWQRQLERLGLSSVSPLEFLRDTASGPYFLLARSEAARLARLSTKSIRNWLLIADDNGYPMRLAECVTRKFQADGNLVIQTCPGDAAHIASALIEARNNHGEIHGIVHLAGLNTLSSDSEPAACLAAQVDRCATAAAIIQACETTHTSTTCWLITAGAATHMLPGRDRMVGNSSAAGISDAALWGFGTTLMNEAGNCSVRMVDLEDPANLEVGAAALDREFQQPDAEREIVITASGERFVPRLHCEQHPDLPAENPDGIEDPTVRLGFDFPGQLKNLSWTRHCRTVPAANELEIAVHATGLNFRDFMYTIGLLADEAVMNGFAGPTLGLEFSGVVLSVGSDTSGFAPGDRVLGFGPASFSNRVVANVDSVVRMPSDLSFEAGATIPSAFFTSYYALHHLARLQEGEKVLIHGATGGVGISAIQIARWRGAEIFATAGSEEKRDLLSLMGVDHVFKSRSLAFAEEILAQTGGKGVDVVLNSLAGEAINRNLRILRPFGRFLELGKRDFYENTKIGLRPFRNNISYFGIDTDQLMLEYPELTRRLFRELMELFREGTLHPLPYSLFESEDIVDAFRYMQQARQIGKIVVSYRKDIKDIRTTRKQDSRGLELPADASYLVTGGLSGFGLKTAEWLAAKGARNLVLISRGGPASKEAEEAIARLEQLDIRVLALSCDVTDKEALTDLFVQIASSLPPLKGIVHAAAVIEDGLIRNTDAEHIRRVLAPKVLGAHYLHEMTKTMPLDFFILFSSATTLFGNPGQGNYVAANAWIEALAKLRRADGLPATCLRWGAIDDAGFLARNEDIKNALLGRMGGSAISSSVALGMLESFLLTDRSGAGVLELDWKTLNSFLPSFGSPKFSAMLRQVGNSQTDESNYEDIQRLVAELSDAELIDTVTGMLTQEVGEILRISPEKIDITRQMNDMGLDSLMGVELATAIQSRFGIDLPVMILSDSPTVAKLADLIVKQLRGTIDSDDDKSGGDIVAQVREIVAKHGVDATRDEIAGLADEINAAYHDPKVRMVQ